VLSSQDAGVPSQRLAAHRHCAVGRLGDWSKADEEYAGDLSYLAYTSCVPVQPMPDARFPDCTKKADEEYAYWVRARRYHPVVVALAPVPIVWVLVYALVGIVRWIRRGFQPSA
jgi:hypothetical protein